MKRRLAQTLGWLILAACGANAGVTLWLFNQAGAPPGAPAGGDLPLILAFLCFPLVGALIVNQRPTNTVGWIFLAAGVGTLVTSFSAAYVGLALKTGAGSQLATGLVDITGDMMWPINLAFGVLLLLLFPDGRSLSRRWAVVTWALIADLVIIVLAQAVAPGPLESKNRVPNPLGIASLGDLPANIMNASQSLILLFIVLAVISLILRYRRANSGQRQQIKWFVLGSIVMIVVVVGGQFGAGLLPGANAPADDPAAALPALVGNLAFALGILALPLGVGVGVLRYKLYDIDRLINRTLLYGALTAILAALFFALVFGAQAIIHAQSQLVIVLSTLLIAALVQPLRSRLQRSIDQRFYRSRYNATRTLDAFGATLRSEVELGELSADLLAVVEETMRPAQLSLWLRPDAAGEERAQ
jgi:hypothetical protein